MYRGKVSLVVNVASKCGYTPQYEGLEKLQREMKDKNFNVLGFPSNDFGGQEPGTAEGYPDLLQADLRRDLSDVRKGRDQAGAGQSPIYSFLGQSGQLPAWNFSKYVDRQERTDRGVLSQSGEAGCRRIACGHREGVGELTETDLDGISRRAPDRGVPAAASMPTLGELGDADHTASIDARSIET